MIFNKNSNGMDNIIDITIFDEEDLTILEDFIQNKYNTIKKNIYINQIYNKFNKTYINIYTDIDILDDNLENQIQKKFLISKISPSVIIEKIEDESIIKNFEKYNKFYNDEVEDYISSNNIIILLKGYYLEKNYIEKSKKHYYKIIKNNKIINQFFVDDELTYDKYNKLIKQIYDFIGNN